MRSLRLVHLSELIQILSIANSKMGARCVMYSPAEFLTLSALSGLDGQSLHGQLGTYSTSKRNLFHKLEKKVFFPDFLENKVFFQIFWNEVFVSVLETNFSLKCMLNKFGI